MTVETDIIRKKHRQEKERIGNVALIFVILFPIHSHCHTQCIHMVHFLLIC